MKVSHVLVGKSEPINAKSGRSGINKRPQAEPVRVDIYGLEGDAIVDTDNHGGISQAVYVFGSADYDYWTAELGRELSPGTFGENLLVAELSTFDVCQGDLFRIGDVELEVTFPRIPCVTLAARMGDAAFPNRFSKSGHVGVYCSVKTAGELMAGTAVEHVRGEGVPILDLLPGWR